MLRQSKEPKASFLRNAILTRQRSRVGIDMTIFGELICFPSVEERVRMRSVKISRAAASLTVAFSLRKARAVSQVATQNRKTD